MTPKEFLQLAWRIDDKIERRIEEREHLNEKITYGRVSNLSGMPRGGTHDWTNVADKVADLDRMISAEINELCRVKMAVNDAIDAVEDQRYRQVLEMRYRNYLSWEEIGEKLNYDPRHVQRLHGKGLLCVRVPKDFA